MPRNKSNEKKNHSKHIKNIKKTTKERIPNEFYKDYISIIQSHERINQNKKVDEFLASFAGHRIDLYVIENIFTAVSQEFDCNNQSNDSNLRKKVNIFYITLVKLLPLCESTNIATNRELRNKLIKQLFECLCKELEPIIMHYVFGQCNDFDYFETYEYVLEKIDWYNNHIEEYYNLLLTEASMLIKSKVSEKWKTFFDTLDEALNCTQQILIFCKYYRLIKKKYSIDSKSISFINQLQPTLSTKKNGAIFHANELISNYKRQILEIDRLYSSFGSIWYPLLSQLYFDYHETWLLKGDDTQKKSERNVIDIAEIESIKNTFLEYNRKKPHERDIVDTWSNVDTLKKIATSFNDYATLSTNERTRPVIKMYSELCLQVLIFIQNNDYYNQYEPKFIHKTVCALFRKIYNDILQDLSQIISIEKAHQKEQEFQGLIDLFYELSLDTSTDIEIKEEPIFPVTGEFDIEPNIQEIDSKAIQNSNTNYETELQLINIDAEVELFEKQKQEKENAHKKDLESILKSNESFLQEIELKHQKELSDIRKSHEEKILEREKKHRLTLQEEKQKFLTLKKQKRRAHKKEIKRLQTLHESELNGLDLEFKAELERTVDIFNNEKDKKSNEHVNTISRIKSNHKSRIEKSRTYNSAHRTNLSTLEESGHLLNPIKQLNIPTEKKFILSHIRDAGIEFYIIGGWVRDRLRHAPDSNNTDFDIIINAEPAAVQNILKWQGIQPAAQPKLVVFGNIDFWCEPWINLTATLLKKDLFVNTFICDIDGKVYDLLDAQKALRSKYLIPLGESEQTFKNDPVRMMRFLRFSVQLNKKISDREQNAIFNNGHLIKTIALGLYLKNISYMFLSPYGVNCYYSMTPDTMLSIFPFLDQNDIMYLFGNSQLYDSIARILNKLTTSCSQNKDAYSVLSLFMLIPVLRQRISKEKINLFIQKNLSDTWPQEKSKILRDLQSCGLNEDVLWSYIQHLHNSIYPQMLHAQQLERMLIQQPCYGDDFDINMSIGQPPSLPSSALVTMNYQRQYQMMNTRKKYDYSEKIGVIAKNIN